MKEIFKRLGLLLLGLIPTRIPTGVVEFDAWTDKFIATYKLPTSDRDSIRFTLASIIMHSGPQMAFKPLFFFFLTLNAAAAKQVAGSVFYSIKEAQKAREAADKAKVVSSEVIQ